MYVLCMKQRTTIQIEHKTLKKLKRIRITKRETYDDILNRVMIPYIRVKKIKRIRVKKIKL